MPINWLIDRFWVPNNRLWVYYPGHMPTNNRKFSKLSSDAQLNPRAAVAVHSKATISQQSHQIAFQSSERQCYM